MKTIIALASAFSLITTAAVLRAEVKITVNHNSNDAASAAFKFKDVPSPPKSDAASLAKFTVLDGERDENGGTTEQPHDGKVPSEEDAPGDNFFFAAGSRGGWIRVDLGSVIEIRQVNTYSWHPNTRGPQVYKMYGSDGKADGFNAKPKSGDDLAKAGWRLVASVDTRPKSGDVGGQY